MNRKKNKKTDNLFVIFALLMKTGVSSGLKDG